MVFVQANNTSPKQILSQFWELVWAGDHAWWAVWMWSL